MGYECDMRIGCADQPQPVQATRLITSLENGDVTATCELDWQLLVVTLARQLEAQADQPAATDDQGDESDEDSDQDEAAAQRLATAHPPAPPDPGVSQVVKRGTSKSRRAHQARQAAKPAQPERPSERAMREAAQLRAAEAQAEPELVASE